MKPLKKDHLAYPLEWFDLMCQEKLNPQKTSIHDLTLEETDRLLNDCHNETINLQATIKAHILQLSSPKKVRTAVLQYYTAVLLLNQQAALNVNNYADRALSLNVIGRKIVSLTEELVTFLENRYSAFLPNKKDEPKHVPSQPLQEKFKLLCSLSADQIGIVLKAADETKLLQAKSLSVVFRSIVPYLSTKNSEHLSWESMRSHTYNIEEIDKEIAVRTLEALINIIKSY